MVFRTENSLGREAGLITLYFRTTVLNPLDAIHIERKAAKFVTHPFYNSTSFVSSYIMSNFGIIIAKEYQLNRKMTLVLLPFPNRSWKFVP